MSGPRSAASQLPPLDVDLAVVGSGAAGLSAALTAAEKGLKVAVFEKESHLGGTSAWSSGWMWIPGSGVEPVQDGDPDEALAYLRAELGEKVLDAQTAKVKAFLESGPEMLKFFRTKFPDTMQFEKDVATPDFHARQGQHMGGRMVRVRAFDGRCLGLQIERLRRPLPEFTFMGLAIEAGDDLNAFLTVSRSLRSFGRVALRLADYLYDLVTCGRGMRLVNGNALIARMMACAISLEHKARNERAAVGFDSAASNDFERLRLFTDHAVEKLTLSASGMSLLTVRTPDGNLEVRATRGLILACGGFPHDMRRIHGLFPPALTYCGHRSAAPEANTGDGLRLGESAGGQVAPTFGAAAAFVPVSVRRRRDASRAVYPHFVDRAKPGVIAVQRDGHRFCNEAAAYHDFVQHWLAKSPRGERLQAWLICDYWFLLRFGLGMVKPASALPLSSLLSGYLTTGWTIKSLAKRCGIEADALIKQVACYNAGAPAKDHQFGRGESAYDHSQGDPLTRPNPCVGRIALPPFFAVQLHPGSLGTLAGLNTDEHAHVLNSNGAPIPGLHACGNDMTAVMGGMYPTNGVTLASAMIFGYRAACDISANQEADTAAP
ncbi:MAG: hypothetical protein RIS44_1492 [Pseudomonadota bacterium]|jgi:succinate dehydrogenase/fumarate reductase flavoprotein subunit